jgi:tripartite ATP-independent transporter DctM subunit
MPGIDLSSLEVGFAGLAAILLLVMLRMPIGMALALVAVLGIAQVTGWNVVFSLAGSLPYEFGANWELSAVPMFLLMGAFAYRSGLTEPLFQALRIVLRRLPGGLAVATNFACAVFAASCGSSVATTVSMGRIAIPEMLKSNYHPGLAAAVCACGGTLGSMIPPSVMMILYGAFTGQSVATLFMAGVLPGLLTAVVYAGMIITRALINPALAPKSTETYSRREALVAIRRAWALPLLVIVVIGSIYGGVATPTEAGAFGAFSAFMLAIWARSMNRVLVREAFLEALRSTATIFFVALGAVLLTRFMALSGVPDYVAETIARHSLSPVLLIVATSLIYLVMGFFLEPISIMLLTLPILIPALEALEVNLIWFGILVVKLLEIGLITPPVGLNVFAAKSLVGDLISLEKIFAGVGWFVLCELLVLTLLVAYPEISLFLPRYLGFMRY